MTHLVINGGPYEKAYEILKGCGFKLHWQSFPEKKPARNSKTKFTCPRCAQNAWLNRMRSWSAAFAG